MQNVLTKDNPRSNTIEFSGTASLLITGEGEVILLRSIGDSGFYPVTDSAGNVVIFEDDSGNGVLFNSDIDNHARSTKYALHLVGEGNIKYFWSAS